jgi:putative endonuclease
MRRSCPEGIPLGKTVEAQVCGLISEYKDFDNLYTTYVLKSVKFDRRYYGHTKNMVNRLSKHNQGKVKSTKAYKPWKVIYTEEFKTKSEAYNREMFFKSIDGYLFLKSINIL